MPEPGSISRREAEVLDLLSEHLTNAEIAARLGISIRTVESHVAALMRKLDVPGRRALARTASTRGTLPWRGRLPSPLSSFIGREGEIHAIGEALRVSRLVTVTGPGGVGKTRTAIEAARSLAEDHGPVWLVDLAPLATYQDVVDALAMAIGVRSEPGRSAQESVIGRLGQSPCVVLLDNCEHLVASVANVVGVVGHAVPRLRLLLTSREPLGLAGERVVVLGGMDLPPIDATVDSALATEAVRLFVDRAEAVRPGFDAALAADAVTSIVRRLDGIPLAIELAAAQVVGLEPHQIDARLRERLTLLSAGTGVLDARHATLEAALEWSYQLLSDGEREMLDRLAVFRGSFSLEAVEAVLGVGEASSAASPPPIAPDAELARTLTALVRKSLVAVSGPIGSAERRRFRLLEVVRQFAAQHLAEHGDVAAWRDAHLDWVLDLAGRAVAGFHGPEQAQWLDILDEDLDNIDAALEWALADPGRAGRALNPVAQLQPYWLARGTRRARGARWTREMSEAAVGRPVEERTRGLLAATSLVMWSDLDDAETLAVTARVLAGDQPLAAAHARLASTFVECLRGRHVEDWTQVGVSAGLTPSLVAWLRLFVAVAAHADDASTHDVLIAISDDVAALGDEHLAGSVRAIAADFGASAGHRDAVAEASEAIDVAQRFGCSSCLSAAYAGMSVIALDRSPTDRAALARQAVAHADAIGEVWAVLLGVEALVSALVDGGELEQGLLLATAVAASRASSGYPAVLPARAAAVARARAVAREQLSATEVASIERRVAGIAYRDMVALATS